MEEDNPGRILLPPASKEVLSAMDYRVAVGIFMTTKFFQAEWLPRVEGDAQ